MKDITPEFIEEYQHNCQHELDVPRMGGTDWRFAERIAPSFKEVLELTKAEAVLEYGFNVGASALLFLSLESDLIYDSLDLTDAPKSRAFLKSKFQGFDLWIKDSSEVTPEDKELSMYYDMVFVDGDHSYGAVLDDIKSALLFNPNYLLFDDVNHPSHSYIHGIIKAHPKLTITKLFDFSDIWEGYSMALCKVK